MTAPADAAHVAHFADCARFVTVEAAENRRLARDTYRLRFFCPSIAERIVPGQFVMLRLAGSNDPLLGRPLALYDTVLDEGGRPVGVDVVYLVVGKLTRKLAALAPGQPLEVWGPLGNGFGPQTAGGFGPQAAGGIPPQPSEHLVMVAGGIGQTPFPALAQETLGRRQYGSPPRSAARAGRVTLCYGARSREYLAGVEEFERLGVSVQISTDDGSAGRHGLVTELLSKILNEAKTSCRVVCCGPERMLEAVAELTCRAGVPCQISLETPMACGIGICFSCVAKVREPSGGWDYRRTCVEGPVFDAAAIEF
ncbi:MAG TPA: dihydroorotate dehydrogenase electron transfer subunit [Pirellulales bacterium]|nr:dihydroorotate dehydrogenase electron transfer subunit [Pirellulales bacterium]